jgi:Polysaccharide biosynthesis protein
MLALKTLLGAGWTVSARLAGRGIDFITVLVLARTLLPADFGLTAIAMTLISIVDTVLEVPLILALISLSHVWQPPGHFPASTMTSALSCWSARSRSRRYPAASTIRGWSISCGT